MRIISEAKKLIASSAVDSLRSLPIVSSFIAQIELLEAKVGALTAQCELLDAKLSAQEGKHELLLARHDALLEIVRKMSLDRKATAASLQELLHAIGGAQKTHSVLALPVSKKNTPTKLDN